MKREPLFINSKKSFFLIEIVVLIAILGISLVAIATEIHVGFQNSIAASDLTRAVFLAQEGIEGVKNIRDARFFDLQDGVYDLVVVNGAWGLQTYVANPVEGALQRKITISAVSFFGGVTPPPKFFSFVDTALALFEGGEVDHKKVKVEVIKWLGGQEKILTTLITRFSNWSPTVVDWQDPKFGGNFDFTSENSGSNSHDARAVRVAGNYLYIGNKNSAAKEFIILSITDTPNLSILGTLDLDASPNKIAVYGNYVFIASNSNTQELQVIDASNKSTPSFIGSYDLPSNENAVAIANWGSYIFLGRANSDGNNFFIFNVGGACSPSNPCLIGQIQLSSYPNDIKVSSNGNYAYAAADDGAMIRINTSIKDNPFVDGSVNLNDAEALTIDITSTRAYVGTKGVTGSGGVNDEIYIINISNASTTSPSLIDSFNLGDNGQGAINVSFASNEKALIIISEDTSKDFQVVNVNNDLPSLLGSLDLLNFVQAADWSETYHSEYVVGQVPNAEIQIVVPNLIYE